MSRRKQLRGFFDFGKKSAPSAPPRSAELRDMIAKAQLCTVTGHDKTGRSKETCRPLSLRLRAPKKGQRIVSLCPTMGSCAEYVIGGRK